jgi:myosin protein heavy chain
LVSLSRGAFINEKRRLEARIGQLEEEIADEQANVDVIVDKFKKLSLNNEQILLDLTVERTNNEKLEVKLMKRKQKIYLEVFLNIVHAW